MASISDLITRVIDRLDWLQDTGMDISNALHDLVRSNDGVRKAVDVLHGKEAGHPVHPIITDVTLGAWLLGSALDVASLLSPSKRTEDMADTLIGIGTVSAVPTMLTGAADYSGLPQEAIKVGTLHGMFNLAGLGLYGLSLAMRKNGARNAGIGLSMAGMGCMIVSGYLGGDLVYRLQVGVNRNLPQSEPNETWVRVLDERDLGDERPQKVDVAGQPVLLYRRDGDIYAIGSVCSHDGGPLEEGKFDGRCVECPWHHSVFDMKDGSVVHGPAVHTQPAYVVRVRDGGIEVLATPVPNGEPAGTMPAQTSFSTGANNNMMSAAREAQTTQGAQDAQGAQGANE